MIEMYEHEDTGKYQLFINDTCMTGPFDTKAECYENYIENITKQKGLLTFPEIEVNF